MSRRTLGGKPRKSLRLEPTQITARPILLFIHKYIYLYVSKFRTCRYAN
jgi:hypothetical protein